MATLTVWKFPTEDGAQRAETILGELAGQQLITIHDAAWIEWKPGARHPHTRQETSLAAAGALGGAFWGLLFGVIFVVPVLGLAIGATTGAIGARLTDTGIDDDFIDAVRAKVTPGTSALFLLSSDAILDRVSIAFRDMTAELIESSMSDEQANLLRDTFAQEGEPWTGTP